MGNCYQSNCDPCTPDSTAINQLVRNAANYARQSQTYSVNSANSATNSENSFLQFNKYYLGAFSVAPTTDNQGGAIQEGALYWNTVDSEMYVYDSGVWVTVNEPAPYFDQFTTFATSGTTAPRNLFNRLTDYVSVKDFLCSDGQPVAGDGVHDDTTGIQSAINASRSVYFPEGRYLVTSTILNTTSGLSLFGDGNATIVAQFPSSSGSGIFEFRGQGLVGSTTVVIADFIIGSSDLFVSNSAIFSPGDLIQITSTEYFNGLTGVSGYQPKRKGELSQVASVLPGQLILTESAKDNYTVSGEVISVQKFNVIENITISGLNFYGTGGGASHTGSTPTGARALRFFDAYNIKVTGCNFLNFPRFSLWTDRCKNVNVTNNQFLGYDPQDPSNFPLPSTQWFTGTYFSSTENIVFASNVGLNSRRHFDVDHSGGTGNTVSRNISVLNNTAINCANTVGGHACDNIAIIGNVGISSGGIVVRGKNCVVSGNLLRARGLGLIGIQIGAPSGIGTTSYPETSTAGAVIISDNLLIGEYDDSILVKVNCDSVLISNNRLGISLDYGIAFGGTSINRVRVVNNIIRIKQGSDGIGIFTQNYNNNLVTDFNNFVVKGNIIELGGPAGTCQGIAIAGGSKESPAQNIVISDNIITGNAERHIALVGTGAGNNTGFFNENVMIANNICDGSVTDSRGKIFGSAQTASAIFSANNMTGTHSGQYFANSGASPLTEVTYVRGMRIDDTDPTAGGYLGKVCVQSGTTGTLVGVTGAINNGSDQLTVSSVANIQVGHYLSVVGSGLPAIARVVSISGLVLTMSANATANVAGAAVTRTAPTFKEYGEILP